MTPPHAVTPHDLPVPNPLAELPRMLAFNGGMPVDGALSALFFEPYVTGRQPHCAAADLHDVDVDAPLLPPGTAPARTNDENGVRAHLAHGPGWTLFAMRKRGRAATVRVCAETAALAREVLDRATDGAARPVPDDAVTVGFWRVDPARPGGVREPRPMESPTWPEISGNYTAPAASALGRLMGFGPADVRGRLVLLHGPAGTGKTTALRALAHSWREWCQVDCVLDPESLFAEPAYLVAVALGDARPDPTARWRLLILEDCDELIRAEAKRGTGQALSRLLNLTDGLLGQGLDVLVCLTTNEDVARLHPAVVRPGRCLAEIEIGPLQPDEARRWLGAAGVHHPVGADGATLAELFRLRGEVEKVEHAAPPRPVGNYL